MAPFPAALYICEDYRDDRDGYAGFGSVSYRITPQLELTGGGRWSHNRVVGLGDRVQVFEPPLNSVQSVVCDVSDHIDIRNQQLMNVPAASHPPHDPPHDRSHPFSGAGLGVAFAQCSKSASFVALSRPRRNCTSAAQPGG